MKRLIVWLLVLALMAGSLAGLAEGDALFAEAEEVLVEAAAVDAEPVEGDAPAFVEEYIAEDNEEGVEAEAVEPAVEEVELELGDLPDSEDEAAEPAVDDEEMPLLAAGSDNIGIYALESGVLQPDGSIYFYLSIYVNRFVAELECRWQVLDLLALPENPTPEEREAAWRDLTEDEARMDTQTMYLTSYAPTDRKLYRAILSMGDEVEVSNEAEAMIKGEGAPEYMVNREGVLVCYNGPGGDVTIPSDLGIYYIGLGDVSPFEGVSLTSVQVPEGVTHFRENAFKDQTAMRSVSLPSTLSIIGNSAFKGCSALTAIDIPSSVNIISNYAFEGCSSLESITLPSKTIEVYSYAFKDCTSLKSVVIPKAFKYGGERGLFSGCTALEEATLPEAINVAAAFEGCTALTHLTFNCTDGSFSMYQNTMESLISGADALRLMTISGDVTGLGATAFNGLKGREIIVELPDNIQKAYVDQAAFPNDLLYYVKPNTDTCRTLYRAGVHSFIYESGDFAFTYYNTATIVGYEGENSRVTVPGEVFGMPVTGIAADVFRGHGEIVSVELPDSLLLIGAGAFAGCDNIADMTIPRYAVIQGNDTLSGFLRVYAQSKAQEYCERLGIEHEVIGIRTLVLSRDAAVLQPKKKLTLSAEWTPAELTPEIAFTSSNAAVATVSKDGVVTAKKAGKAVIRAEADGLSAECAVTVAKAPRKVTLKAQSTKLGIGDSEKLTVKFDKGAAAEVTFSSSNDAVLTVDADGVVKAVGEGDATVTAKAGKVSGTLKFNVAQQATGLTLNVLSATLVKGGSCTLKPTLTGGNALVRYASSNDAVATVDGSGKVVAVGGGEAMITATTLGGLGASFAVRVNQAIIQADSNVIAVGDSIRLNLIHLPEADVTWKVKSSSTKAGKLVKADGAWWVVGTNAGSTTITATTSTGAKATLKVTVKKKAKSGTLIAPVQLAVGDTALLSAKSTTSSYASIREIIVDEGSEAYVRVDGLRVTGLKLGVARLQARLYNDTYTGWQAVEVCAAPTAADMRLKLESDDNVSKSALYTDWGGAQGLTLRVAKGDYAEIGVDYKEGVCGSWTASSTNEAVLKASGGRIDFVGTGVASAVFTAYNGEAVRMRFQVLPAPKTAQLVGNDAVTVGFQGVTFLLTDRGYVNAEAGLVDSGYDYLHLTLSGHTGKVVRASRTELGLDEETLGLRKTYILDAKASSGSAAISAKLFNGVKAKATVKGRANKVAGIYEKPSKALVKKMAGGYTLILNSVSYSGDKLVAEFCFVNGTNRAQTFDLYGYSLAIDVLKPLDLDFNDYTTERVATSLYFKHKYVKVSARSWKSFKVTYTADQISKAWREVVDLPAYEDGVFSCVIE